MAMQSTSSSFTGIEDSLTVTWTAMAGNFGISAGVTVTDALGPVSVALSARTLTGCTITPSARFTGTVELTIFDRP